MSSWIRACRNWYKELQDTKTKNIINNLWLSHNCLWTIPMTLNTTMSHSGGRYSSTPHSYVLFIHIPVVVCRYTGYLQTGGWASINLFSIVLSQVFQRVCNKQSTPNFMLAHYRLCSEKFNCSKFWYSSFGIIFHVGVFEIIGLLVCPCFSAQNFLFFPKVLNSFLWPVARTFLVVFPAISRIRRT